MPDVGHSALTGTELHEPKGASGASADTVYKSDGAGSGSWTNVNADEVQVTDSGGYFTGTEVETVLQEVGAITTGVDPKYGGMYISGNSTATTISSSSTYVQVTAGWTAGTLEDVTFTTDHLVLPSDGTYFVFCDLSFEGATNDTWKFDIHYDTGSGYTAIAKGAIRRKTSSADVGALAVHAIYSGSSGDKLALFVQNETDTDNCVVTDANFSLLRLKA